MKFATHVLQTGGVPRVSVVLIFFNEERFLEEAVCSVQRQTMTDWELTLVDDGSTDRSTQIARTLSASDARIRYVEHDGHENRGMAASRNFGTAQGSGEYVAFIDADDVWIPSKLTEQVGLLDRMPDIAMVNGALCFWHSWDPNSSKPDERVLTGGMADRRLTPPEGALEIYPLASTSPAGVDFLVRRSVFRQVGGFEERFRGVFEDQSFLIKVYLRFPVYVSSSVWLRYRQHAASSSAHTSRIRYVHMQGKYLDWLEGEVDRLDDARVGSAFLRARRRSCLRKLLAPMLQIIDSLRASMPAESFDRLLGVLPLSQRRNLKSRVRHVRQVWRRWWL